ncbi:MAG: aromatic amino acid lyase [Bacteroidetes bacterium]|nr:aromatic amino acid lyase [Bacteroidota bacterium]
MVKIGDKKISADDFYKVLISNLELKLDEEALRKVYRSHYFLKEFTREKLIYGINTGFGPMAQYRINHDDQMKLQYNLIRSHCSGSGNPIPEIDCKAVMLARLNTLMQGFAGIHPDALILIKDLINKNISPVIYEHGGLGASGDLVQLAHLALTLIGEGEVYYNGVITSTAEVFKKENITPMEIHIREGLALMNGTSAMSGIGMLNVIYAENLMNWSLLASATIMELVQSFDDHYSTPLNEVKHHYGQNRVANALQATLKDSKLVKSREEHHYNQKVEVDVLVEKMQEYYSIRCVPQIVGPIVDTVNYAKEVLINEINSANDNPIVDWERKNVYHGGNFHGDYVALEMDKLKISITKLSMLAERQLNFLLNNKLNNILPPFVNHGTLGLNLGMQGVQFTATSTTAENQMLSNPMYVHSIPSNNDNQDIVSMGANASLICKKVILNSYEVLAIEWMTILQAIDYLKMQDKLSSKSKDAYEKLRKIFPCFVEDTTKYKDVKAVRDYIFYNHIEIL